VEALQPRPISEVEALLIRRALEKAPMSDISMPPADSIDRLNVVCRCICGCASVGFVGDAEEGNLGATRLADAEGLEPSGRWVGLIIWGTPSQVTSLEVYGMDHAQLPSPDSLGPYRS
jgi:hypothetical protein